jgi:hypothetical protein
MATIYDAFAGADRLNASLAGIHRANFARLNESFAQIHRANFVRLNEALVPLAQPPALAQISASLAGIHRANFARLSEALVPLAQSAAVAQISASLAKMNQANFTQLSHAFAHIYQTQFTGLPTLNANLIKTWQPLLDAVLELKRLYSLGARSVPNEGDGFLQRLSDREIAAMLTVVAFLTVYVSFALLIQRSPQVAKLAATSGPTPFEAAMAIGALVFWLSMNHLRGSRGE